MGPSEKPTPDLNKVSDEALLDIFAAPISPHACNVSVGVVLPLKPTLMSEEESNKHGASSGGSLDCLPIEVLHLTMELLDLKSLFHLLCTSWRVRAVVEALPAYRSLVTHAPEALAALTQTDLVAGRSAEAMYAQLRSAECVACGNYGPFLHLTGCRRYCITCLSTDVGLRLMTFPQASVCFGVSHKDLRTLPVMHGVPGRGGRRVKGPKLVCVKDAHQLGLRTHGSEAEMSVVVHEQHASKLAAYFRRRNASTGGRIRRPMSPDLLSVIDNDPFDGCASVQFPSVNSQGQKQNGVWCLRCRALFDQFRKHEGLPQYDEYGEYAENFVCLMEIAAIAWSNEEFPEHVRSAHSAAATGDKDVSQKDSSE